MWKTGIDFWSSFLQDNNLWMVMFAQSESKQMGGWLYRIWSKKKWIILHAYCTEYPLSFNWVILINYHNGNYFSALTFGKEAEMNWGWQLSGYYGESERWYLFLWSIFGGIWKSHLLLIKKGSVKPCVSNITALMVTYVRLKSQNAHTGS